MYEQGDLVKEIAKLYGELKKLKSAGCDIVLPRSSLVKNIPKLLGELIP